MGIVEAIFWYEVHRAGVQKKSEWENLKTSHGNHYLHEGTTFRVETTLQVKRPMPIDEQMDLRTLLKLETWTEKEADLQLGRVRLRYSECA
jgi:hypothetical protein